MAPYQAVVMSPSPPPSGTVPWLVFLFMSMSFEEYRPVIYQNDLQIYLMLPHDESQDVHSWLDHYISDVISFPGNHIRRHMISECPSWVMLILMTRFRHCPVSPLCIQFLFFPLQLLCDLWRDTLETMQWSCSPYDFPPDLASVKERFLTEPVFIRMFGKR